MRHRRICRQAPRAGPAPRRAEQPRVPRLRLRRHLDDRRRRTIESVRAVGNLDHLRDAVAAREDARRRRGRRRDAGPPRPASATRAGPRTAASTRRTPTRTSTRPGRVHVVVNGIVENYMALKERLAGRWAPSSRRETDAEVIAHLISHHLAAGDLAEAVRARLRRARGPLRVRRDDARRARRPRRRPQGVPAGRRPRRRRARSSPPRSPPSCAHTRRVQFIENGEIVVVTPGGRRRS